MEILTFIVGVAVGICVTSMLVTLSLVKELLHLNED